MKRYLAFLLTLVMFLSLSPIYGDEPKVLNEDEAGRKLKNWGALKGSKDGNLMKEEGLKREDAILILIRMMGKEEEAEATPTLPSFKDIEDKYYYPYIAFAQAQGWTEGRNRHEFGYKALVTADEFSALMLRALGYDYKGKLYSKVGDKAKELGLYNNSNVNKAEKFRRGSAFVMMYNTLQLPKKGGGDRLIEILGYEKKPEPIVLKLEDARARGLREIELVFNKPVSFPTIKNFKLTKSGQKIDIKDIKVQDENKKVVLILTKPTLSTDRYSLKVEDMKSLDLKEYYNDEFELNMADNDKPVVVDISAANPKLIKLKMSEPISVETSSTFKTMPEIMIDGRQFSMKLYSSVEDEYLIELISPLNLGGHKIEISDFKDMAGNMMERVSFEFEVIDDKTPPQLLSGKFMSFDKIKLVFDEPIYDKGEFRVNEYTLTSYNEVVIDQNDRRIVYLNLPRPVAYRFAVIFFWKQTDIMLNQIKEFQSFKIEMEEDKTPPAVLSTQVDKVDLIVTFSEPMTKNLGMYTIKQDGKTLKKVTSIDPKNWYDEDKLILNISNLAGDANKSYNLILEGFRDASLSRLELPKYETNFQALDTKQPTAEEAYMVVEHFDQTRRTFKEVKIIFSEEMDRETLEDPKNYTFKSYHDGRTTKSLRGDQADIKFTATPDGRSVYIRALDPKAWIDGVIELTGQKDRGGNYLITKQVSKFVGEFNKINRASLVGRPGYVTVEVEFQNTMEVLNDNSFVISDNYGRTIPLRLLSFEGTKASFLPMGSSFSIENDGMTLDGQFLTLKLLDPNSAMDVYSKPLPAYTTIPLVDRLAPGFVPGSLEVVHNRRLSLVFTEPMDNSSFVIRLFNSQGAVVTYRENGLDRVNTVSFSDETLLPGNLKHRKISFQTAGPLERGGYKLVISQAKDRNQNFMNDGYEMELDFYMDK